MAENQVGGEGDEPDIRTDAEPQSKVLSDKEEFSAYDFHQKTCKILIAMAVLGGVSAAIGYLLAPDSCDPNEDTIFETFGITSFYLSVLGVPINIIIWLISLFYPDTDSGQIFYWAFLHVVAVIICMFVFGYFLTQDMFCGCWGFPGENC